MIWPPIAKKAALVRIAHATPVSGGPSSSFTQSVAKELGPDGNRVKAILPGRVEGPRIQQVTAARAKEFGASYQDLKQQYLFRISLG